MYIETSLLMKISLIFTDSMPYMAYIFDMRGLPYKYQEYNA